MAGGDGNEDSEDAEEGAKFDEGDESTMAEGTGFVLTRLRGRRITNQRIVRVSWLRGTWTQ